MSQWDATLSSFWEVLPNTKPLRERSQALVHVPQWSARLTSSSTKNEKIGFIRLTPGQLRKKGLLDAESASSSSFVPEIAALQELAAQRKRTEIAAVQELAALRERIATFDSNPIAGALKVLQESA